MWSVKRFFRELSRRKALELAANYGINLFSVDRVVYQCASRAFYFYSDEGKVICASRAYDFCRLGFQNEPYDTKIVNAEEFQPSFSDAEQNIRYRFGGLWRAFLGVNPYLAEAIRRTIPSAIAADGDKNINILIANHNTVKNGVVIKTFNDAKAALEYRRSAHRAA